MILDLVVEAGTAAAPSRRTGATSYVLASDGERGRDQRDALRAAAERFGMPMALPDQTALADAGLSYQELARADSSSLDATIKKIGDLPLVGSMVWSGGDARLGRRLAPRSAGQGIPMADPRRRFR